MKINNKISRNSYKSLRMIYRWFLKVIPPETALPILRGKLIGKKWILETGFSYWSGSYEGLKRSLFENTIKKGSVVFDIGAHVGFYTLLASLIVGSEGRVMAFEPVPNNLYYLKKHLKLNHATNVTVMEVAVSNRNGIALFDKSISDSMGHISPKGNLQVDVISLDELFSTGKIPLPDVIKMDIEGAEVFALQGAKFVLENAHPTIFLATHGDDIYQKCCHFLNSLGYSLQCIEETKLGQLSLREIIAHHSLCQNV